MKALALVLALAVADVVVAAPAELDYERFAKQLAKYATQLGGAPRGLCLCRDAALSGTVGYLLRGSIEVPEAAPLVALAVSCFIPTFDDGSGVLGTTLICEDFDPMVR